MEKLKIILQKFNIVEKIKFFTRKEKIKQFLKSDFGKHFMICFGITIIGSIILTQTLAILIAMLVGVGKEWYDKNFKKGGFFDWKDISFDLFGIAFACAILNLANITL